MKILIACNIDSYPNPYVKTLYNGLINKGIDVTCSIDEFWSNATNYDIVHIQWPNLLVDNSDVNCQRLLSVIKQIREYHIPLISTCHNLVPHYNADEALNNAYRIVYTNCDHIQHLGKASIKLLKDLYPEIKANHFIVPHHTYDEIYDLNSISKEEARKKLGIPQNIKCILSMGMFRHDEEREIIISLRKDLKKTDYYILAPGFFRMTILRKNIFLSLKALLLTIKYSVIAKYYGIQISHKYIPDEALPLYLKAADVMLIQRKKILNSGNVSLALLAGLPIVGPNDGNVESILRETGNFIFDRSKLNELPSIIKKAGLAENIGKQNFDYAMKYLTTNTVADSLISFYLLCI